MSKRRIASLLLSLALFPWWIGSEDAGKVVRSGVCTYPAADTLRTIHVEQIAKIAICV